MKIHTSEMRIQLAQERGIIVDEQDMWLLAAYTWRISLQGYAVTTYMYKPIKLHHCIMGHPIWEGESIDHIDRNKLNYRRSNLRWADQTLQVRNSSHVLSAKHIYPLKTGRFLFQIMRDGDTYHKNFETLEQAEAARDAWLRNNERT